MKSDHKTNPIAIIGMDCFFPKSSGLKAYWRLLFQGADAITDVPESHWSIQDYYDKDPKKADHTYCTRGGFLSPVSFDPVEFGLPPTSLEATDTSQILALVAAKMALEDAGYGNGRAFERDRTSVILGVTGTQELVIPLSTRLSHPLWRKVLRSTDIPAEKSEEIIQKISDSYVSWQENSFPGLLGNVVAGRISNRLDLGGTNCVVDAACASSMSAIHLGVMELLSGRSNMVVTGGVDTLNDIFMHMCFSKTSVLSPTGDARPFSENADGTVLGEGIGIIILKRLEDAERDKDRIYAVIKALGSSSDGKSQSIYAPSANGQAKALRMAYDHAGVDPATVELIEAHGTGTRVGDAVEFKALNQFFGESARNGNRCAIGSVKSMIGHTKAAAGAAGLIKALLSLHHKVLPPTLKAEKPDPAIKIEQSPFYLNSTIRPWFSKEHPRRSGVSAFGFGGSNFHLVLEEYRRDKSEVSWDGSVQIFALSAATAEDLLKSVNTLRDEIEDGLPEPQIDSKAAGTRKAFNSRDSYRLLMVYEHSFEGQSGPTLLFERVLETLEAKRKNGGLKGTWQLPNIFFGGPSIDKENQPGKIAFLFPGQGSQYIGMGRDLVCCFPEAHRVLEKANQAYPGATLLSDLIYPLPAHDAGEKKTQSENLRQTETAQPAIGAISLAMLEVLRRFGLKPDATAGHSFGELTALYAADRIDAQTLLDLAVLRGRLMASAAQNDSGSEASAGTMLAVSAPLDQLEAMVGQADSEVILANRNSPNQGVLSGPVDAIVRAQKECEQRGWRTKRLPVSAAFHSRLIKDAQKPLMRALQKIAMRPSDIPVLSNITGGPYPQKPDKAGKMLGEQLLRPVDFVAEIETLFDMGVRTFIEVGPRAVLSGLVRSILSDRRIDTIAMDPSGGKRFGLTDLAGTLCHLASSGHAVDLTQWEAPVAQRVNPQLSIPVLGANFKPRQKGKPQTRPVAMKPEPIATAGIEKKDKTEGTMRTSTQIDKPHKDKQPQSISDALRFVREGLQSMQALHTQTAEAHKKFLESQSEASRALQAMMENVRRLWGDAPESKHDSDARQPDSDHTKVTADNPEVAAKAPSRLRASEGGRVVLDHDIGQEPADARQPAVDHSGPVAASRQAMPDETQQGLPEHPKIESVLLAVVGDLTGYPIEMLGLDMEIEADLGIDSIKRVEILSTLEEKISNLPALPPEMMGSIKTLGQIVDYLAGAIDARTDGRPDEVPGEDTTCEAREALSSEGPADPEIESVLLAVVSDLTGYPIEMLGLDMEIEADLGIDSIKRVEILSALEEKISDMPAVPPEMIGSLKTLGQICAHLTGSLRVDQAPRKLQPLPPEVLQPLSTNAQPYPQDPASQTPPQLSQAMARHTVAVVKAPPLSADSLSIVSGRKVYITADNNGLSEAIAAELERRDCDATVIPLNALATGVELDHCAGLIIVPDIKKGLGPSDLRAALMLSRHFAPDLMEAARCGGSLFATITRLDGAFGFKGQGVTTPLQGGLAGLVKTAAIEWEGVCCRAVDIDPEWNDPNAMAVAVVDELLNSNPSGPVEVGLEADARWHLKLKPAPYTPSQQISTELNPGDVVVVSGGARGITAAAARALAEHTQATMILLGRSPLPSPEPEWLNGLEGEVRVKKAIIANELTGSPDSPAQVQKIYQGRMANREILSNLERLKKSNVRAQYFCVDVRDPESVGLIFDTIRETYGPIRAVIHGAGVLEDRLIVDKTPQQFNRVFETKVKGIESLLQATRQDPLKYLVLFSSIAARQGNTGQVDYAMANEVLNKIARQEAVNRHDCRVISINWGPWDGGMVSASLKREFARNRIVLIPLESGALCLLHEMMDNNERPVEVVVGAEMQPGIEERAREEASPLTKNNHFTLSFKREVDIHSVPILGAHVLDGKPVVPFALMTEWLGHGALHGNPGLSLVGIDDMRLLKGIKLEQEKRVIRILAAKAVKKGTLFEVEVELQDGFKDGREVVHSKAKAILSDRQGRPPAYKIPPDLNVKTYPKQMGEVYDKILFHGLELHGIREIVSCLPQGVMARLSAAPPPHQWMTEPLRSRWIGDPLVLDSAFQMAIVWCYEEMGVVSLPSYSASYRQYRECFPAEEVTAVLEVKNVSEHKMKGDFTILDADDVVVAQITGYEAVMDESLFKAFKPHFS